jgi:hypothetical protein
MSKKRKSKKERKKKERNNKNSRDALLAPFYFKCRFMPKTPHKSIDGYKLRSILKTRLSG